MIENNFVEDREEKPKYSRRGILQSMASAAVGWTLASPWAARAQEASEKKIQFRSGRASIDGIFVPAKGASGPQPAILLIHPAAGLDDRVKEFAQRLAREGYAVMAPDFTSREKGATEKVIATHLNPELTVQDVKAAYEYLKKRPNVDTSRLSAVGLGWGSWRAFMLAEGAPDLHRLVAYYGSTPTDGLARIQAPMLVHYPEYDFRVTGNAVWIERTMKELKKSFSYKIYQGAKAEFVTKAASPEDKTAADESWAKTLDFLKS